MAARATTDLVGGLGSNLVFGGLVTTSCKVATVTTCWSAAPAADTIIDALGDDIHVGGHVANQLTDDFFRQVLAQWDNGQTQNSRFKQGLMDDDTVDSLFDSLGDDWFVVGDGDLKVDINPFDHDLLTAV